MGFCFGTLTVVGRRARRGDLLGWLVFLYMVYYLLLNMTNAITQEYFEPVFVIILLSLGLMASKSARDPPALRRAPTATPRPLTAPPR